jgi:hypothetical protein
MRFEDKYGCRTLFEHSNSVLNNNSSVIRPGLGNKGVFKVRADDINMYDYTIIIFDLDAPDTYSLTSEELINTLRKSILERFLKIKHSKYQVALNLNQSHETK